MQRGQRRRVRGARAGHPARGSGSRGGGAEPLGARGAVPAVGRAVPRLPARARGRCGRRARRGAAGLPAPVAPALPARAAGAPAPRRGERAAAAPASPAAPFTAHRLPVRRSRRRCTSSAWCAGTCTGANCASSRSASNPPAAWRGACSIRRCRVWRPPRPSSSRTSGLRFFCFLYTVIDFIGTFVASRPNGQIDKNFIH